MNLILIGNIAMSDKLYLPSIFFFSNTISFFNMSHLTDSEDSANPQIFAPYKVTSALGS